jgi:hypothetical protein
MTFNEDVVYPDPGSMQKLVAGGSEDGIRIHKRQSPSSPKRRVDSVQNGCKRRRVCASEEPRTTILRLFLRNVNDICRDKKREISRKTRAFRIDLIGQVVA